MEETPALGKKKMAQTLALFRKSCTFASQFRKEVADDSPE